jgi:glucosamine--fructose-6-phosphate aminotransferase (isomerizing)
MCGIIGIVSEKPLPASRAVTLIKKLEYRGYDSAGFLIVNDKEVKLFKDKGRIEDIARKYNIDYYFGKIFLAHTRWATHGEPNQQNAHPVFDCTKKVFVIHNGTLANFIKLRDQLAKTHEFESDTDSELIAHLIEEKLKELEPFTAFKEAVKELKGSYAIVAYIADENKLFFAKKDNPLWVGIGKEGYFISSDLVSLAKIAEHAIMLEDLEVGYINSSLYVELNGKEADISKRLMKIDIDENRLVNEKDITYEEIYYQPIAIKDTLAKLESDTEKIEELLKLMKERGVLVIGSGTSYHAALFMKLLFHKYFDIDAIVASEYYSYSPKGRVIFAISQSGETLDVIKALKLYKKEGVKIASLTNSIYNSVSALSDISLKTAAGPEIGVAATKTFAAQIAAIFYLYSKFLKEEAKIELNAEKIKEANELTQQLAKKWKDKQSMLVISRGLGVPIAMEGALKIKELSYIHAEGYPAGESKHGPIALANKDLPVIAIDVGDRSEELQNNVEEMKSRGAEVLVLKENSNNYIENMLNILPNLQLLAFHLAKERNLDPDKPRNLAKTVTVE